MSDLFVRHKDKIISIVISSIVSAFIGYFVARIDLENRISTLEANYANMLQTIVQTNQDIDALDSKQDSLGSLPDRMDLLQDRVDAYSAQTDVPVHYFSSWAPPPSTLHDDVIHELRLSPFFAVLPLPCIFIILNAN